MTISVLALAVQPAGPVQQAPARGRGYVHLNCAAGIHSAGPSASHLAAFGYAPDTPADMPRAAPDRSVGDLAEACAARLAGLIDTAARALVGSVLHCQATLNENVLESVCLRIGTIHYPASDRAMAIDQAGTAGTLVALQLSRLPRDPQRGACILSAADKWLAPFVHQYGTLAAYGDAASAMMVAPSRADTPALARVHAVATRLIPRRKAFWDVPAAEVATGMVEATVAVIAAVLAETGWTHEDVDQLFGEPYGFLVPRRIATGSSLSSVAATPREAHLSSAAAVENIALAVRAASEAGRAMKCVIWSASLDGTVGAMALTAYPGRAPYQADGALVATVFSPQGTSA